MQFEYLWRYFTNFSLSWHLTFFFCFIIWLLKNASGIWNILVPASRRSFHQNQNMFYIWLKQQRCGDCWFIHMTIIFLQSLDSINNFYKIISDLKIRTCTYTERHSHGKNINIYPHNYSWQCLKFAQEKWKCN